MVPAAGLIDEAVFRDRRKIPQLAAQVGAGLGSNVHLARRFDLAGGGLHAGAVRLGGHQPRQHLGRLHCQQDLGARRQDVVLFRREQQRHQASESRLNAFSPLTGGKSSRFTTAPMDCAAINAVDSVCGWGAALGRTVTVWPACSWDKVSTCCQAFTSS
ncbi:hypothetical protein G6F57_018832 [Rhizopus arrhizus]|nr:hypothetical protein G6F57_018832 [Rhizopus arrhizus]